MVLNQKDFRCAERSLPTGRGSRTRCGRSDVDSLCGPKAGDAKGSGAVPPGSAARKHRPDPGLCRRRCGAGPDGRWKPATTAGLTHAEDAQEIRPAHQDLRRLQAALHLAQEMDAGLGPCPPLLGPVQKGRQTGDRARGRGLTARRPARAGRSGPAHRTAMPGGRPCRTGPLPVTFGLQPSASPVPALGWRHAKAAGGPPPASDCRSPGVPVSE